MISHLPPTHKVSGGIDAQPVTHNGKPVRDTYIDAEGTIHRDTLAVDQSVDSPVDINGRVA